MYRKCKDQMEYKYIPRIKYFLILSICSKRITNHKSCEIEYISLVHVVVYYVHLHLESSWCAGFKVASLVCNLPQNWFYSIFLRSLRCDQEYFYYYYKIPKFIVWLTHIPQPIPNSSVYYEFFFLLHKNYCAINSKRFLMFPFKFVYFKV